MRYIDQKYYQLGLKVICFLLEGGHNLTDARNEFGITKYQYKKAFECFLYAGADPKLIMKNKIMYILAMKKVKKENILRFNLRIRIRE